MSKISFYLRDKEAQKPTPILMYVSYFGRRLTKYPTGEAINPSNWDKKSQRVKQRRDFPTHPEFNARLSAITAKAETVLRRYMNENDQEVPPVDVYRSLLDRALQRTPKEQQTQPDDLFGFISNYLKELETKIFEKTGRPITSGSLRAYKQTFRVLQEFRVAKFKNREFSFKQIDYHFYSNFQQYLAKENFSTNTIGRHIKTLKTLFLEAKERGLMPEFSPKKFRVISEVSDSIYLNEAEITTLFNLNLKGDTRLQRVRDLFLVGCWTGLRFSDFTRITRDSIEDRSISIVTQKTNEPVVVPIHSQVAEIMERYKGITDNSLPQPISNQKMNDYLKELGELAGFSESVSKTITKGGIRRFVNHKKYELITTHTARRSFATNTYLRGFPTLSIMKITGHRTEAAFMKYIKITPRDTANKLLELWTQKESESLSVRSLKTAK